MWSYEILNISIVTPNFFILVAYIRMYVNLNIYINKILQECRPLQAQTAAKISWPLKFRRDVMRR